MNTPFLEPVKRTLTLLHVDCIYNINVKNNLHWYIDHMFTMSFASEMKDLHLLNFMHNYADYIYNKEDYEKYHHLYGKSYTSVPQFDHFLLTNYDKKSYERMFVEVKIKEDLVQKFKDNILNILPNIDLNSLSDEDAYLSLKGSSCLGDNDYSQRFCTIDIARNRIFKKLNLFDPNTNTYKVGARVLVTAYPGNHRDCLVTNLDTKILIKKVDYLAKQICYLIPQSKLHDCTDFDVEKYEKKVMFDYKKYGMSIPFQLIIALCDALYEKYKKEEFLLYKDRFTNKPMMYVDNTLREIKRGTGLGFGVTLHTLINIGLLISVGVYDFVVYNDDSILDAYVKKDDNITDCLKRLETDYKMDLSWNKSFISRKGYVFCEQYPDSWKRDEGNALPFYELALDKHIDSYQLNMILISLLNSFGNKNVLKLRDKMLKIRGLRTLCNYNELATPPEWGGLGLSLMNWDCQKEIYKDHLGIDLTQVEKLQQRLCHARCWVYKRKIKDYPNLNVIAYASLRGKKRKYIEKNMPSYKTLLIELQKKWEDFPSIHIPKRISMLSMDINTTFERWTTKKRNIQTRYYTRTNYDIRLEDKIFQSDNRDDPPLAYLYKGIFFYYLPTLGVRLYVSPEDEEEKIDFSLLEENYRKLLKEEEEIRNKEKSIREREDSEISLEKKDSIYKDLTYNDLFVKAQKRELNEEEKNFIRESNLADLINILNEQEEKKQKDDDINPSNGDFSNQDILDLDKDEIDELEGDYPGIKEWWLKHKI
jgi:hypothetical protein